MNAVRDLPADHSATSRNAWGIAVATRVIFVMILTLAGALSWAAEPGTQPPPIRGEIVLARASHPWMSQPIEEPCILPNPKVPGRLIMFDSAVASSNRVVAAVGKAWADTRSPFRWHQDEANPIFGPSARGWDSTTIRLDAVLHIPEEDAYYIYYSGSSGPIQDRIGLAICPAGTDGYSGVKPSAIARYGAAPVLAVSTDPVRGWTQLDLDTMLQTKWQGLYDDRTLYHVATPALYRIKGKWYLFAQACGRPLNANYIDGAWEMWGVACDRAIVTRPDCAPLYIPGPLAGSPGP